MKIYLTRVRLNSGGYTSTGQYFGIGAPLYHYQNDEGDIYDYVRAYDRQDAKQRVLARYPDAKFTR